MTPERKEMERDVPIHEIVVDMPVSEVLVRSKMRMLQKDGLIQPLAIWQHGMLVIDGFHRLEAAKRLGWKTVRCSIIDVSEEQFWASRIDSAKQHHEVEKPRLLAWIRQCWQASEYAKTVDITETLWRLRKKIGSDWELSQRSRGKLHLSANDEEVLAWFDDHAARWSMSTLDIFETIMSELSGRYNLQNAGEINDVAAKLDLPIKQLAVLRQEIGGARIGEGKRDIPLVALERFVGAGMPSGQIHVFAQSVRREQNAQEEQRQRAELERWNQEEQRFRDQIVGIAALADAAQDELSRRCESLLAWMKQRETMLSAAQGGKQIITEHIEAVKLFADRLWPTPEAAQQALTKLQDNARQKIELESRLTDVLVVHGEGSR